MGLTAVIETVKRLCQMAEPLSEADKEYVIQFAFRTGDEELTNMLIDKLKKPETDRKALCQQFETIIGSKPELIRKIENLLVALEIYRIQEERAAKNLSQILSADRGLVNLNMNKEGGKLESKHRL